MSRAPTKLGRLVERELRVGLSPGRRAALIERLRGKPEERALWERNAAAFRILEQAPVASVEIEQVERWLFEDLAAAGSLAEASPQSGRAWWQSGRAWWQSGRAWWRTPLVAGLASVLVAAAALAVIVTGPEGSLEGLRAGAELRADVEDGELRARGQLRWSRPLAIDLACGIPARPVGGATGGDCGLGEVLGFSARLDAVPANSDGPPLRTTHLSLFGIDAQGALRYYAPTPEPARALPLASGAGASWRALPISVRLGVNHSAGELRVFAIATPIEPKLDDIQRWAASLRAQAPAGVDSPPWHLRLSPDALGPDICGGTPASGSCASAETTLDLLP